MSVSRLDHITKIGVEDMGDLADSLHDSEVLRLENLDTDLRPPESALGFTRAAVDDDAANSYLPFLGLDSTRQAAAALVGRQARRTYDWRTECVISAGGLAGVINVLLATLEPGDEVLMTDPIYVGLINRVRLAGGIPRFVPLKPSPQGWRLDTEALEKIDPGPVKAALLMSPSMPTGAVFDDGEWAALAEFCRRADCWLINDSAMERILFDDRSVIHPATLPGLEDKVITVGSASKEYRMIGWRVGWVVGPAEILADVARVSITNVVCQTGIAMGAVATAIEDPDDGIPACVEEWQSRRDLLLDELEGFAVIPPHGGWSFLVDVSPLGLDGPAASKLLLERGKIAATAMVNWGGPNSRSYVRIVFSNEPVERLRGIGKTVSSRAGGGVMTDEAATWQRKLLWVDGLGGASVGVLVLLLGGWLSELYRLPRDLVFLMGWANLAYGTYSTTLASRPRRPMGLDRLAGGGQPDVGRAVLPVDLPPLRHRQPLRARPPVGRRALRRWPGVRGVALARALARGKKSLADLDLDLEHRVAVEDESADEGLAVHRTTDHRGVDDLPGK